MTMKQRKIKDIPYFKKQKENPETFDDGITRVADEFDVCKKFNHNHIPCEIIKNNQKGFSNNKSVTFPSDLSIPKNHNQRMYKLGYDTAIKEILEFIEHERDNGNFITGSRADGFSAGLCLSKLLKELKEKQ